MLWPPMIGHIASNLHIPKHSDEIFSSQLNWSIVNVEKGWIGNRRFQELMGNPKIKKHCYYIFFYFCS